MSKISHRAKTSCRVVAAQLRRLVAAIRDVAVRIIVELEIAAVAHLHFPHNSVRRAITRWLRNDRDFVSRLYAAAVSPAQSRSPEGRLRAQFEAPLLSVSVRILRINGYVRMGIDPFDFRNGASNGNRLVDVKHRLHRMVRQHGSRKSQ